MAGVQIELLLLYSLKVVGLRDQYTHSSIFLLVSRHVCVLGINKNRKLGFAVSFIAHKTIETFLNDR